MSHENMLHLFESERFLFDQMIPSAPLTALLKLPLGPLALQRIDDTADQIGLKSEMSHPRK